MVIRLYQEFPKISCFIESFHTKPCLKQIPAILLLIKELRSYNTTSEINDTIERDMVKSMGETVNYLRLVTYMATNKY
jgi:hypothetical protein